MRNFAASKEKITMDATLQDLMTRRSVRSYTDEMPSKEVIEEIVKAGMNAPSGKNRQSAIILAVTNRMVRDTLSRLNSVSIPSSEPLWCLWSWLIARCTPGRKTEPS